jgi:hypothetical protein
MTKPLLCPNCGAKGSLTGVGPGVERLAEEVHTRFRGARVEVLSSDTVTSPDALRDLIQRMEGGAIDILIGTQIVAKGHNFPTLTLVGVSMPTPACVAAISARASVRSSCCCRWPAAPAVQTSQAAPSSRPMRRTARPSRCWPPAIATPSLPTRWTSAASSAFRPSAVSAPSSFQRAAQNRQMKALLLSVRLSPTQRASRSGALRLRRSLSCVAAIAGASCALGSQCRSLGFPRRMEGACEAAVQRPRRARRRALQLHVKKRRRSLGKRSCAIREGRSAAFLVRL